VSQCNIAAWYPILKQFSENSDDAIVF